MWLQPESSSWASRPARAPPAWSQGPRAHAGPHDPYASPHGSTSRSVNTHDLRGQDGAQTVAQHPPQRKNLQEMVMCHRTSSHDLAYHPYRATAPASTPKSITFVDANQQAAAASKGGPPDGMQQSKPKRKRIMPDQLERLLAVFDTTDSPSYEIRERLGSDTCMTNREVQVWFQNRRAKVNRQRLAAIAADETARTPAIVKDDVVEADPAKASTEAMSVGQHQWRFHPSARSGQSALSSAQTCVPPPTVAVPSPRPTSYPIAHVFPDHPYPYSPPAYTYAAAAPSPFYPHAPSGVSPTLPHGVGSSSYFGMASPSLSVATPSLASPGTASTASYFPFTPNTCSSPSGTFFRLTLDSPRSLHPLSPELAYQGDEAEMLAAKDAVEARIELRPMRSTGPWLPLTLPVNSRPSARHSRPILRRSISDPAAHAAMLPPPIIARAARTALVRLPSLRGLLNDDEPSYAPVATASAPTSPISLVNPLPLASPGTTFPKSRASASAPFRRPSLASHYSSLNIHAPPARPRSTSHVAPSGRERMAVEGMESQRGESNGDETLRADEVPWRSSLRPSEGGTRATPLMGVGLGMLVAAASAAEIPPTDDEKLARLAAAKEMR